MGTYTAQHPDLLEADEKDILFKQFSMIPLTYDLLLKTKDSKKAYEEGMKVAGLGRLAIKAEGTPVAFDDPVSGDVVRTVHSTYALGFRVTEEMMDDDLFSIIQQMPADLGDSARDHMERLAWGLPNDGFAGATYTGLDGLALFSAAHTSIKTATTQSNLLAPPVALSVTALEAILTRASTAQSEEDRFINLDQSLLVFHPNLQHQVYVLLDTEYRPGTSDNDRSTVVSSRSGLSPITRNGIPYLTSETAWMVFSAKGTNDLTWNDRRSLRFDQAKDADTFDLKHYASYRASVQFYDWRGCWGCNA